MATRDSNTVVVGRRPGQRLGTRPPPDTMATATLRERQAQAVGEVEQHPALLRARAAYGRVTQLVQERETKRTQAFQVAQHKVVSGVVLPEPTDAELRGEAPSQAAGLQALAEQAGAQAQGEIDREYDVAIEAALREAQQAVEEFEAAFPPPLDMLLKALSPADAPRLMALAQELRAGTAAQFSTTADEAIVLMDRGAYTIHMRVGAALLDPETGKFGASAERDVVEAALARLATAFATVPLLRAAYARALLDAGDGRWTGLALGLSALAGNAHVKWAKPADLLPISITTGTFTAFTPIPEDADLGRRWEDVVRAASAPESSVWVLHGSRLVRGGETSGEARGPVPRFHDLGPSAI